MALAGLWLVLAGLWLALAGLWLALDPRCLLVQSYGLSAEFLMCQDTLVPAKPGPPHSAPQARTELVRLLPGRGPAIRRAL